MPHNNTRRSGTSLVLAGIAGTAFFWLTDPRWGIGSPVVAPDIVDAINQIAPGTYIGIAGCIFIGLLGLWLLTRKMA